MVERVQEGLITSSFTWSDDVDASGVVSANALTTGTLELRVNQDVVWAGEHFVWNWIELLEWLTSSWRWLVGEDGLPGAFLPETYKDVRAALQGPGSSVDSLWEFNDTHELSCSLTGALIDAPVLVWREGLLGHVLTNSGIYTEKWSATRAALEALGERVNERLAGAVNSDERARKAHLGWESRRRVSSRELVAVTGIGGTVADTVVPLLPDTSRLDDDSFVRNELLAVAKMSASLPPSSTRKVIEHLRALPKVDSSAIDGLASQVRDRLHLSPLDAPHEQALEIAQALREVLDLSTISRFDPRQVLEILGVHVREVDFETQLVRALAAWGAGHGPGVLLNRAGTSTKVRARADLAHELCHLLVDRAEAVPAADLLAHGRSRPPVEQRANAFAAEMLMPRVEATAAYEPVITESDARRTLAALTGKFQVSRVIVAWQVLNSSMTLPDDVRTTLRSFTR